MPIRASRRVATRSLLVSTALAASPVFAQTAPPPVAAPPVFQTVDPNGVDLSSGQLVPATQTIRIGNSGSQLSYSRTLTGNQDSVRGTINSSGSTYTVTIGPSSENFTLAGSAYTPAVPDGSSLTYNSTTQLWTYTMRDGTVATFNKPLGTYLKNYTANQGVLVTLRKPTGEQLNYHYRADSFCYYNGYNCSYFYATRLQSITSNMGYQLQLTYMTDTYNYSSLWDWAILAKVTLFNLAVDSCSTSANTCTLTGPVQTLTIGATQDPTVRNLLTDTAGRTTTLTFTNSKLTGVQLPGHSANDPTFAYDANGRVQSATSHGVTTTYAYNFDSTNNVLTTTVTDAAQKVWTYQFSLTDLQPISKTDPLGHTVSISYNTSRQVQSITSPENNHTDYAYDSRGNITSVTAYPKSGSGTIATSASYPASCTNTVTCNKPATTTDANGNVTSYSYDSTTGAVTSVTLPAASVGAVQPQIRYSYSPYQAYFGQTVYLLTGISECQTQSSCAGTSDESKSSISYAGTASNLLPISKTSGDGTGTLAATSAFTYDALGNLLTVDGPLPGAGDTTRYRYDTARQLVGVTSADPDGAGALVPTAVRLTYRPDGQVSRKDVGTVSDQSDAAWSNFSTAKQVDVGFDANSRPNTQVLSAGGTTYAYTQENYDTVGRVDCTAVRMNPAVYGSLPDACTPSTQGSYGPDQIAQNTYDAAGELTQVEAGVGTIAAAPERTLTYTANGKLATLKDGMNNLTTYVYDGFDRLSQTQYPSTAQGAGTSNSSDYSQLSYDANGNITSKRNRDGTSITYAFDALNRVVSKTVPTSASGAAGYSVFYGYDLLGRQTYARFSSAIGSGITNTYDALGRLTSSASNMDGTARTVSSQYDAAGNRTGVTETPGSYNAGFDYDQMSRMTAYQSWAQIGYDSLGRRSSVDWGSSGTTSSATYGYDAVDRLTSLTHDLAGTGSDQTLTFGYSPASQITARTSSNDSYAYNGLANVNRNYTANGLNQYTAAGPATFTYDANGNLTSDGSNNFVYDAENKLVSVSGAHTATLSYDPLGRLWQVSAPSGTTDFVYDGDHEIVENDGAGNWLHSYVWGPAADEPLVQWDASGAKMLHADQRGSIISIADSSGNIVATNSYDEYGTPAAANQGRFQYTGQAWLSEIGLYYYKARMYSPTLGRFLQTDPSGVGGGINLYGYAANNPVNNVDPTGNLVDKWDTNCYGNCGPGYGNTEDWSDYNNDLQAANNGWLSQDDLNQIDSCVGGGGGSCMGQTLDSVAVANLLDNFGLTDSNNLASPNGGAAYSYGPLTPSEQTLVSRLLATPQFQSKAAYAFNLTQISNVEHGFFIWILPEGAFKLSGVYTGTEYNMGLQFLTDANSYLVNGPPPFATFHVHWGDYPAAMGPSGPATQIGTDLFFDRTHNSIGILENRNGQIIYGW